MLVAGSIGALSNIKIAVVLHLIIGILISWSFLTSLTEPDSITPTYVPIFFPT